MICIECILQSLHVLSESHLTQPLPPCPPAPLPIPPLPPHLNIFFPGQPVTKLTQNHIGHLFENSRKAIQLPCQRTQFKIKILYMSSFHPRLLNIVHSNNYLPLYQYRWRNILLFIIIHYYSLFILVYIRINVYDYFLMVLLKINIFY